MSYTSTKNDQLNAYWKEPEAKTMQYKLEIYPAIEAGNPSASYMFETKVEMKAARSTCADLLLFMQDQAKVMDDYSNIFMEFEKDGLDWIEIDAN